MSEAQVVTLDQARTDQPPRLPSITAGNPVRALVPQDFEGAWRIANAVAKAGMAPRGLETPEKAMVAIMHGLEVGLTPMNALQSIAVVNGRPTIWGDGAIGLARGSGLLEWMEEAYEGKPFEDAYTATCKVKRKGEPKAISGTFSVADAKLAGLWGKAGPWTQYPKRMLQMRARAFALRDGFADVLKGLAIKEEVEDYQHQIKDVTPAGDQQGTAAARKAPPPPPVATEAAPAEAQPETPETSAEAPAEITDAPATAPETISADGEILPPEKPKAPPPPGGKVAQEDDGLDIPANLRRAQPPKQAPTIPNAGTHPEEFVKWAFDKMGAAKDPDTLADVWETEIAPRTEGLFPPDQKRLRTRYSERLEQIG